MQFVEAENAAAQVVVAKQRGDVCSNGGDESVVDRDRNVVAEQGRLERGRVIAGASAKDIRLHRVGERRRQGELVILKLSIELVKGAFPQLVIALHEKRAERTLGQRFFFAFVVDEDAELHVDVG